MNYVVFYQSCSTIWRVRTTAFANRHLLGVQTFSLQCRPCVCRPPDFKHRFCH